MRTTAYCQDDTPMRSCTQGVLRRRNSRLNLERIAEGSNYIFTIACLALVYCLSDKRFHYGHVVWFILDIVCKSRAYCGRLLASHCLCGSSILPVWQTHVLRTCCLVSSRHCLINLEHSGCLLASHWLCGSRLWPVWPTHYNALDI